MFLSVDFTVARKERRKRKKKWQLVTILGGKIDLIFKIQSNSLKSSPSFPSILLALKRDPFRLITTVLVWLLQVERDHDACNSFDREKIKLGEYYVQNFLYLHHVH